MSNTNTTKYIWFNGQMVEWEKATVHVMTHALHYGSSVFEGIRAYNTPKGPCIFRLNEHIDRLFNSARIYRFKIPYTKEELREACCRVILENGLDSGYIRPLVFIGNVGLGVRVPEDAMAQVIIGAIPWGAYLGEEGLEKGVKAGTSSWNRLAPNTIPTVAKAGGNYLSSILIANECAQNGYTEAVALDTQGYLSEGSGENIFLIIKGVLYTAPSTCGLLSGITRDTVMTLAKEELGMEVRVERIPREMVYLADEMFFTGTAAELTPIASVDGIDVGEGRRGPQTKILQETFFKVVKGEIEDRWGWLYPCAG